MSVQAHFKVTHQEADGLGYTPVWKVVNYTHADLVGGTVLTIPIEAGTHVLGVAHWTKVAFDNAADLTVGDVQDADGYITAALATPTTINDFVFSLGQVGAYGVGGKFYAATNRIVLTFTADPAAGAGQVRILMSGVEA